MDLDAFVAEHAVQWRRLEQLSRRRRPGMAEVDEMLALYQRTGTHLSMVRSNSPDPALVARLSRVVLTARGAITGSSAFSWRVVGRFFTERFPLAVYEARRWWCAVGVLSMALTFFLIYYVAGHPDTQHAFLSDAEIDKLVNQDFAHYYSDNHAQNFALQVWTNNALLTGQCLASGILLLPVIYLLANNLLNVGLEGGVMVGNSHGAEFYGLIAPHGLLELTAVFVGAGAGLRIGWAWIAPGPDRTRGTAVAQTARSAMLVALGLVGVLAVSGLIEAFVTPSPLPTFARVAVGVLAWSTFIGYVWIAGSHAAARGTRTDLDPDLSGDHA